MNLKDIISVEKKTYQLKASSKNLFLQGYFLYPKRQSNSQEELTISVKGLFLMLQSKLLQHLE